MAIRILINLFTNNKLKLNKLFFFKKINNNNTLNQEDIVVAMGIIKKPTSKIEFPAVGNKPLIDSYVIKPDGSRVRISSKAKAGGNIVKPEGILDAADEIDYGFENESKEQAIFKRVL